MPILKCIAYNSCIKCIPGAMEEVQTAVWFGYIFGKMLQKLIHDTFLFFNTIKPVFSWESVSRQKNILNVGLNL